MKHHGLLRTSDQPKLQATACFGTFAQVSGLGCIDLGDRRSEVQILSPDKKTGLFFFKLVVVAIRVFIAFVVVVFVDKDAFFACH